MSFDIFLGKAIKEKVYLSSNKEKSTVSLYDLSTFFGFLNKKFYKEPFKIFFKDFKRILNYEDAIDIEFGTFGDPKIKKTNNGYIITAEIRIFSNVFDYYHTYYNIKIEIDNEKNIVNLTVSENRTLGDFDPWLEKERVLNTCIKMAPRFIDLVFKAKKYECRKTYYTNDARIELNNWSNVSVIEITDINTYDYLKINNGETKNYVSNYKSNIVAYQNEEKIFKNIFVNPLDFYSLEIWEDIQMIMLDEKMKNLPKPKISFFEKIKRRFF